MPNSFMKSIYDGYAAREKGDPKEALECFQKALDAEKDSPIAAYEVASFYEQGEIVPQDLEKAYQLYMQAAEGCVEMAQAKLAEWYEKGVHVEKKRRICQILERTRQRADEVSASAADDFSGVHQAENY